MDQPAAVVAHSLGYLIVRTLLPLVRGFARLPRWCSRGFAATLQALTSPFHAVNYLGSCLGGQLLAPRAMAALLDRTVAALNQSLDTETPQALAATMAFPTRWDPYFRPMMTLELVYSFASLHFAHHRRQLTL